MCFKFVKGVAKLIKFLNFASILQILSINKLLVLFTLLPGFDVSLSTSFVFIFCPLSFSGTRQIDRYSVFLERSIRFSIR